MIYRQNRLSVLIATAKIIECTIKIIERRNELRARTKERITNRRYRRTSSTDLEPRPYRRDYFDSSWWKVVTDPLVANPTSAPGKLFRRRFRVPYPVFQDLMEMAQQLGFPKLPISAAKVEGIPLELQVLGVLRVLGRGTCFDGIEELTGGSAEAHRVFFHSFNISETGVA